MDRTQANSAIQVHSADNVAVALRNIAKGEQVSLRGTMLAAADAVPAGHKIALRNIERGSRVVRYGAPFGIATSPIVVGAHVHTWNVGTALSGIDAYSYDPIGKAENSLPRDLINGLKFQGYRRRDGRVGTRNEIWIISTVGCVSRTADRIAAVASERFSDEVDGVFSIKHPFGCSQLGDDLVYTQTILAGLIDHPNAGGVLVLGLGCESNQLTPLLAHVSSKESNRIRYFNAQAVDDEVAAGVEAITELANIAQQDRRSKCSITDLTLGLKCGGSDGFSGLSANPLVGRICDAVEHAGGRALLTEIPEMFGAERLLMNRCADPEVFARLVSVINDFKQYFIDHDQPIYENPSPGNIAGGITTLEEKSLGATQKGGSATVADVLRYGEPARKRGLSILEAPGNDGVSSTAMVASGANMLLFTTGRGTPLGFPAPTIKISSNSTIANRKQHWIDFDAGAILQGETLDEAAITLLTKITTVASGEATCNERNGEREIAIWKRGVTL